MPYIDVKLSVPATPAQREELKTELGKAITLINKPESFLMIGIEDDYDLYFGGNKLEKGAYVAVSMLGEPNRSANESMTARVTEILQKQFDIPPKAVYISYHGVRDWGWKGSLF